MGSNYDLQVQRAKEAFLRWDNRLIAEKFSLRRDSQWIYLPYLGRMHRINCETGDVEVQSGEWSTVNHLEGLHHPGVGEETMYGDIALAFSGKQEQMRQIGAQWGAEPFPVGDAAFVLRIFPFLPMVFQFWEGDEEFPPQIRLLWDSNMLSFVRYETIWYIAADFLGEMKRRLCP